MVAATCLSRPASRPERLSARGAAFPRSVKHPDLLIATAAETAETTLLHYDADDDLIAALTGPADAMAGASGKSAVSWRARRLLRAATPDSGALRAGPGPAVLCRQPLEHLDHGLALRHPVEVDTA